MIYIKSDEEIALMRKANQVVRDTLNLIEENIKEGVSTKALDKIARDYIEKQNCTPSFLGYSGYPASICASINEEVVHGIPSSRKLNQGDIISIDIGAIYKGWNGDAARTFGVGKISQEKQALIDATKQSFFEAIKFAREGFRLGDIGAAVQNYVEPRGYSVVRALVGHGIGKDMHEDPSVPNFGKEGRGIRLKRHMALAIEPMINIGTYDVEILSDGWTVVTADGKPSAHYENTIIVAGEDEEVEILSL